VGESVLVSTPFQRTSHRFITGVREGVVPVLQRCGPTHTAYTGMRLREVLPG
jgi:hypothetical protein